MKQSKFIGKEPSKAVLEKCQEEAIKDLILAQKSNRGEIRRYTRISHYH